LKANEWKNQPTTTTTARSSSRLKKFPISKVNRFDEINVCFTIVQISARSSSSHHMVLLLLPGSAK